MSKISLWIVILYIALLIEGRVYSEFNQVIPNAISVFVIEGLYSIEPEKQIDQIDQQESLQDCSYLRSIEALKISSFSTVHVDHHNYNLCRQNENKIEYPSALHPRFDSSRYPFASSYDVYD